MKKETIKLLGEDVVVAFNLAVQIAYEDITEKPFVLTEINGRKQQAALYMAVIIANNPETKITMDSLLSEASFEDLQLLDVTIGAMIREWYNIPNLDGNEKANTGKQKHAKRP